ncbi:hypothetical protein NA56DRAFT_699987 [Hyaloscypha hepaticicola]|uniref:Uncharacterized protein n=1 Tax=Hyaloscypha hepaticicola TaxID=2082293 RepID=A0A2J6QFX6_9HELO|nr:hypothetical protein NA56DRAFT_699987 [Hyaloscypha hepaticicola]
MSLGRAASFAVVGANLLGGNGDKERKFDSLRGVFEGGTLFGKRGKHRKSQTRLQPKITADPPLGDSIVVANLSRTTDPTMKISMFQERASLCGTGVSMRGKSQAP